MSPLRLLDVALDVLREAFARKLMIGLFAFIVGGLLLLLFALDLEVVEGTLAAGRLFGMEMENAIIPIDVAMKQIFGFLAYAFFYFGMLFGVVATAGVAADMLQPGRVEWLLSLPVRRTELVVGTYLGVLGIALIATSVAVGGTTLILWGKTGYVTFAPLWSAVSACIAFSALYGLMLLATTLVRSMVLAAGAGLILLFFGVITSNRVRFLEVIKPGFFRDTTEILITPRPRFHRLASAAAEAANGGEYFGDGLVAGGTGMIVLATLGFACATVAAAALVVHGRDY